MNRISRYARAGVQWYLSPSGALFGLAVILLGAGLLPMSWSWVFTLAGLALLAVFVPYRLNRQQARGDRQVRALRHQQSNTRKKLRQFQSKINGAHRVAGEGLDRAHKAAAAAGRAADAADVAATTSAQNRSDFAERISISERGLADRMATYRSEVRDRISDLDHLVATNRKLSDELGSAQESAAVEITQLDANIAKLTETVEQLRVALNEARTKQDGLAATIADERSRRIVGFARRDSSKKIPERVAIIVAVPRTGSTWSFDMLRTMPSVFVEPSLLIWDQLGLRGRRYPAGLSDSASASLDVEVSPGVGAEIESLVGEKTNSTIAIEKLHPEFYGFSPQTLDRAIERLENHASVAPIYQVRNPVEVMWSFAKYKQRDEAWYRQIPMEGIPAFVHRTFESLEDLIAIRPGFIVDFRDLYDDAVVGRLFAFTDPTLNPQEAMQLVERARLATKRDTRLQQQRRPFLGAQMGSSSVDVDGPDGAWLAAGDEIAACHEIYERLLAQREPSPR